MKEIDVIVTDYGVERVNPHGVDRPKQAGPSTQWSGWESAWPPETRRIEVSKIYGLIDIKVYDNRVDGTGPVTISQRGPKYPTGTRLKLESIGKPDERKYIHLIWSGEANAPQPDHEEFDEKGYDEDLAEYNRLKSEGIKWRVV